MQQTYQIPSLHGPPSFGQTVHSVPITRCCSIHPLNIPNWGLLIYALFVTNLPYHLSLFPQLPCVNFCLNIANHVSHKTSKVFYQGYSWNTWNMAIMILQITNCCAYYAKESNNPRETPPDYNFPSLSIY